MKTLPVEYWKNDYVTPPTYYQRYWVQRCLELLDADTGYISGLPLTNSASLIRELVNTSPNRPNSNSFGSNARTFHFLLNELKVWSATDDALQRFLRDHGSPMLASWYDFRNVVELGTEKSSKLFTPLGDEINNAEGFTRKDFANWLQENGMANGVGTGIVRRIYELLEEKQAEWLKAHESIIRELLDQSPQKTHTPIETALETVTSSWLFELIMRGNCSPVYIGETFSSVFLKYSKQDFLTRLGCLFEILRVDRRDFIVFMRLQARRELGSIGQVGHVLFSTNCQEGDNIVAQLLTEQRISPTTAKLARDFFYQGETNPRFVFARAQVKAENVGNAARLCLQQLDAALQQARFEFERSKLSVDNTLYVYDNTDRRLERFTGRQAQADRYIALGHPVRFERLIYRLNQLRYVPEPWVKETIISQIADLALQWHRHAIESSPSEIRFMNHWIELEQLFKTAEAEGLTSLSPGDAVVQALAHALAHQESTQVLKDFWGDLKRCDVLGPKPYLARHTGRVRYTSAYLARISGSRREGYPKSYRRWKKQPIDIEIRDRNGDKRLKGYRIPPGYKVFVNDNHEVTTGDWLAGPRLDVATRPTSLRSLFDQSHPNLVGVLYLVRHWTELITAALTEEQRARFDKAKWKRMRQLKLQDVQYFEQAQRLADNLSYTLKDSVHIAVLLSEYSKIDERLKSLGWPSETGLRVQLKHTVEKLHALEEMERMSALYDLSEIAHCLRKSGKILDVVWYELFRDCPPDYDVLSQLLSEHIDDLSSEMPDQPLLRSRIRQVHQILQIEKTEIKQVKYIWELDRMRRARNSIVHTGAVPETITLLARRIYDYSKIYIRLAIYKLTMSSSQSLKEAFYLP